MTSRTGYQITIKGFVAVDPGDLEGHAAAIDAIQKAKERTLRTYEVGETPDANPFFDLLDVETFEARYVTRRKGGEE